MLRQLAVVLAPPLTSIRCVKCAHLEQALFAILPLDYELDLFVPGLCAGGAFAVPDVRVTVEAKFPMSVY